MVLSGVPSALPSLIKAYRIQDKARNVGFDWEERSQVWTKVKEEIGEFEAEVENMDKEKAEAEFGDVMFSLINAARLYKINPDNALELTNQKFIRRFPKEFNGLPRRLNTAWVLTSRLLVMEPLAESPSVIKIQESSSSPLPFGSLRCMRQSRVF